MTTNPLWPEIQAKLLPHQSVYDVPAVVCRAFHGRLEKLKVFLRQNFGGLAYEVGVIEFQKRDLPHAHIVIKFKTEPSLSVLDSFISPELPDPNEDYITKSGNSISTRKITCPALDPVVIEITVESMTTRTRSLQTRTSTTSVACITVDASLRTHGSFHICLLSSNCSTATFLWMCALPRSSSCICSSICSRALTTPDLLCIVLNRAQTESSRETSTRNTWTAGTSPRPRPSTVSSGTIRCGRVLVWSASLEGRNLTRMRRPGTAGYSDMSNLLWYFQRPSTLEFLSMKYMEFFSQYYLITMDYWDPARRSWPTSTPNEGHARKSW